MLERSAKSPAVGLGWARVPWLYLVGLLTGFLGQLLAFQLWMVPASTTSIWIPGGVMLAFLLVRELRCWPALLAGFIVGGTLAFFLRDARFAHALVGYTWMTGCIAVAARVLVARAAGNASIFSNVRELVIFFLVAVVALPTISAAGAVAMVILAGGPASFPDTWLLVIPSHAVSYMLLTPPLVGLLRARPGEWARARELLLLCTGSWILSYALWHSFPANLSSLPLLLFAPIPLLLFAAVRFDSVGTGIVLLATIIPAAWLALHEDGSNHLEAGLVHASIMQLWAIATAFLAHALAVQSQQRLSIQKRLSTSNVQKSNLAAKLMRSQEDERIRISRELHDGVNQQITSIAIALSAIRNDVSPAHQPSLESLRKSLLQLTRDIRQISHNLHPAILQNVGLASALEALVQELARHWGGEITLDLGERDRGLDHDTSLCLYRISQEALCNAIRHAGATSIRIRLQADGTRHRLDIVDNGRGFDVEAARSSGGLGLLSMEERARQLGGNVAIESEVGMGTAICVEILVT